MTTATQPPESTTCELLTKDELAVRLKKSPRTITSYMRQRQVPFIRLNPRTVFFNWNEVLQRLQDFSQ
jgi:hypothetical protein